jgi:hypothetical protein
MARPITDYSRVHYRVPVHYPAVLVIDGKPHNVLITDLSTQGCAAEEQQGVPPGSEVRLLLHGPTSSPIPILTAIVRWRHGTRCGIEFVAVAPHTTEQLRHVVIEELGRRHVSEANA